MPDDTATRPWRRGQVTHTYAIMEVSQETFDEIRAKLLEAGYDDQIHPTRYLAIELLDMHGIALQATGDHRT